MGYDLEYFFRVYVSVEVVEREVDMMVVRPVASRASRVALRRARYRGVSREFSAREARAPHHLHNAVTFATN